MTAFRLARVGVQRRNRMWLAIGASPWLLALGFGASAIATGVGALFIPVFPMAVLGVFGFAHAFARNVDPVSRRGTLTLEGDTLLHDGTRVVSKAKLARGVIVPTKLAPKVRLERRGLGSSVVLEVEDTAQAHAVLQSLGFDTSQTIAEMRGASMLFSWSVAKQMAVLLLPFFAMLLLAIFLSAFTQSPVFALASLPLILAHLFAMTIAPTQLRIGIDGVGVKWLWQERFIPFSSVREVKRYRVEAGGKTLLGVELVTREGSFKIPCGQEEWADESRNEIFERLNDAFEHFGGSVGEFDAGPLARGHRDVRSWVDALRAIGNGANADMRTSPVAHERLLRVMEDATAAPLVRVGAAVAVLQTLPEQSKERVRIAAVTTVSPPLHRALSRLVETSGEDAVEALEELEASEAVASKRARR